MVNGTMNHLVELPVAGMKVRLESMIRTGANGECFPIQLDKI